MTTRHTPGPWRVETEPYIHVRSDAGCVLAADYTTDENAALICAAPDLLLALSWLVGLHDERPADYEEQKPLAWAAARAAIKAVMP